MLSSSVVLRLQVSFVSEVIEENEVPYFFSSLVSVILNIEVPSADQEAIEQYNNSRLSTLKTHNLIQQFFSFTLDFLASQQVFCIRFISATQICMLL